MRTGYAQDSSTYGIMYESSGIYDSCSEMRTTTIIRGFPVTEALDFIGFNGKIAHPLPLTTTILKKKTRGPFSAS